jgi:hypothetical protein
MITLLAFYAGYANAISGRGHKGVFAARNIGTDLPLAFSVAPLPINRRGVARNVRPGAVPSDRPCLVQRTIGAIIMAQPPQDI